MNNKYLIIRFSSLGDVVLTLPVIESIRQYDTRAQIDFLTKANYEPLVKLFPGITNVYAFDKSHPISLKKLRKVGYGTVIDLQKNPRSVIYTARINPSKISSYPKRRLQRELLIRNFKIKPDVGHIVDAYLKTLTRLKIPVYDRMPKLVIDKNLIERGMNYLKDVKLVNRVIGLCPGSKHPEKRWSGYAELANLILQNTNFTVLIISDATDDFLPNLGILSPRIIACRGIPLDILTGVISNCDIVVANDSGLMHLAVALGIPTIAIFGPTHPSLGFAPLGSRDRIVCDHVACSPCSLHGEKKCRMPEKYCFKDISPKRLFAEIMGLIDETSGSKILRKTPQ
jgi:heptosyltransferase-2